MSGSDKGNGEGRPARERLLASTMEYVSCNGVGDLSLRRLASALGTSHRMLVYHFGSKAGLLAAVVQSVEEGQRLALTDLLAAPDLDPIERMRQMWRRLADPRLWPSERLFFEIYGQALQGRSEARVLLDGLVELWLAPLSELNAQQGMDPKRARATARLQLAVARGLLLDLLATGERAAVDEAAERFIALLEADGAHGGAGRAAMS